jgi:hypothetical protein
MMTLSRFGRPFSGHSSATLFFTFFYRDTSYDRVTYTSITGTRQSVSLLLLLLILLLLLLLFFLNLLSQLVFLVNERVLNN